MEDTMIDLTIDANNIRSRITQFIKDTVQNAGYQRAVIGLSGGIDSALSCYLAAEALGDKNVFGIRMPYRTSSPESLTHAKLIIDSLGINSLTVPITDMVDPLVEKFPDMNQVRKGNIMARMRMIILFDQSAAFNGLVVGSGNKTEILLGYTTLFGDSACAFNPVGDLYKTQVRQLAEEMGVPEPIRIKPPSADLWSGQTDEGEMGLVYAEVDQLLYLLFEKRYSPQQCTKYGFDPECIQKVINIFRKTNFKRTLPPIASVGNRPIDEIMSMTVNW